MTCIAGLVDGDSVLIAGDSAGTAGYDLTTRLDPKVFVRGGVAIGFTTSFRMGQLLQYRLDVPRVPTLGLHQWMSTRFVDAVRDCLKTGGFATRTSEQESGGTFLVGVHGRLFSVETDYQVAEHAGGIAAVGCGAAYALGSLATSSGSGSHRLRRALRVSERFSAGVRGPFTIVRAPAR